jgi:hypothetical protein
MCLRTYQKVKAKGMGPPSMGPPPNMGPPGAAPSLAPAKVPGVSGGGRHGASLAGAKNAANFGGGGSSLSGGLDLEDAEDDDEFGSSGYGGAPAPLQVQPQGQSQSQLQQPLSPDAKQTDMRPNAGGESPGKGANDYGGELGSSGLLGGPTAQSRARVLAQQRELQMRRRQQV